MKPFATIHQVGRLANQGYQIAFLIAYALKNNLRYYVPRKSSNGRDEYYWGDRFPEFTDEMIGFVKTKYEEPVDGAHQPSYHEVPAMENVIFHGYWQSFKYFEECRKEVLAAFNLPFELNKGVVGIHHRRGDYLKYPKNFPVVTLEYIEKGIEFFHAWGFNKFKVFGDDIMWCKEHYKKFYNIDFEYSEHKTPLQDFVELSNCEGQLVSNSSFSFLAAWFHQGNNLVACPSKDNLFIGANKDMIPEHYYQIKF